MFNFKTLGAVAVCLVLASGSAMAASDTMAQAPAQPSTSVLGPVSLGDSVRYTINYHPTIRAFQEYRQAADFDLKRSRSGWLPRVDLRAGYGIEQWNDAAARQPKSARGENTWYDRFDASLVAQQTIWDGLATLNRYRFSEARLASAAERLFDNAEGLSLDAVLTHIEIYRQRKLVALSELNVQNHLSILASQEERQRGGAASLADVTQTQGRLARSQSSLTDAQLALAQATALYRQLTGKEVEELAAPFFPENPYPSLEVALATCQTNNSKIKALVSDVDAAIAQKGIDKAAFHPQIYVEAGPQYRWYTEGSSTYTWGTAIQLRAVWNLYNGHYDWYNLKANKAKVRQSKLEVDRLKDELNTTVSDTWYEYLAAREQTKFYTNAVDFNTQTRDMYLEQFNIGQRSLLDVLDAENELYNSSMLLVTSQLNQIATQYRLKTLGGELLDGFNIDKKILAIETDIKDFGKEDLDSDPYQPIKERRSNNVLR